MHGQWEYRLQWVNPQDSVLPAFEEWPPKRNVFNYRDVIPCPTSE